MHFDAARLTALFLKPHLHLAPMARAHGGGWSAPAAAASGEDAYQGYDYHNANDASFVSAHGLGGGDEDDEDEDDEEASGGDNMFGGGDDDDGHDIDFDVDVAPMAAAGASSITTEAAAVAAADGGELQLVAAPRAVSKIEIGYARAATKVDVKALKHGMWQQLSEEAAALSAASATSKSASGAAASKKRFSRPAGVGEPAAPAASELCSFQARRWGSDARRQITATNTS